MGTKDFNALDLFICRWRSRIVRPHVLPGARLLDFGCGHQALFLRSISPQIREGIGIDYDADPGQVTPNVEIRRLRFVTEFPFPAASFDQISLLAVIEHLELPDVEKLFTDFRRVLRPGGTILITTPTRAAQPMLEFMAFRLRIISQAEIADHRHYWSEQDLRDLATRHGLECTHYRQFLFGFNCFAALRLSGGAGA